MSEQQHLLTISKLNERCAEYRNTIAQQLNTISNSVGYKYPSRAIVEYALKTQQGSSLNIPKATKEFFESVK
jgi:hypothetical protein